VREPLAVDAAEYGAGAVVGGGLGVAQVPPVQGPRRLEGRYLHLHVVIVDLTLVVAMVLVGHKLVALVHRGPPPR